MVSVVVVVVVMFGFLPGWKTSAIFYLYITSCIIYGFYSMIAQKIYAKKMNMRN